MIRRSEHGTLPRLDAAIDCCDDPACECHLSGDPRAAAISVRVCGAPGWQAATTKLRVRLAGHGHRDGVSLGDPHNHSSGCPLSHRCLLLGMTIPPTGYDATSGGIPLFTLTNSAPRDGM